MICTKRRYESIAHAREGHKKAGYRIRVYRCHPCRSYHVTNADKRAALTPEGRLPPMSLAPEMTLAEVEAIAAQKRS